MDVMVVSASPEWQEVSQAVRKVVAAVRIDGLEEAEDDPDVHREDVQILADGAPQDGCTYCAHTEDHDFNWRGVLSSHAKRRRVLMVDLVDILVQWSPM